MDSPSAWYQVCAFGHTFSMSQAYSYHKWSCHKTKKQLASALEKAKEVWEMKKHRKVEEKSEIPIGSANVTESTSEIDVGLVVPAGPSQVLFNASCIPCD